MRWLLPLLLCACDEVAAERGIGEQCDPERACSAALLCLDGLCAERPTPPAPADATLPPVAHYDIVEVVETVSEVDVVADVPEVEDEVVAVTEMTLGPHDALTNPSETRLGLASGQAAAREVTAEVAAQPVAIEAVLAPPGAGIAACARYVPALWLPDVLGAFTVEPTWRAEAAIDVNASDAPTRLSLEGAPAIAPGQVRYGIVYDGPCIGFVYGPWLGLDASGDASSTFVWANVWIPGATLGLDGRWGLSLVVAVGLH